MKTSMKITVALMSLLLGGVTLSGHAEMTAQQNKMGECNKQAADMKGDERKAFMSNCLKKDKPATQQNKMKECNKQAGDMKGDERKAFMSTCLKKSTS